MASSTVKDIRALIATKVGAVVDGSSQEIFQEVFEYPEGNFSKYPAAVVLPTGGSDGIVLDTARNERTFHFEVKCYQEQSEGGKGKEASNEALTTAVDALILAFDQDKDLGGEVELVRVVRMEFDFRGTHGTFDFATIHVDAMVVVPNYGTE